MTLAVREGNPPLAAVAIGTYLEITHVGLVEEAAEGDSVYILVHLRNNHTTEIYATVTVGVNGTEIQGAKAWLQPGAEYSWPLMSFVMPNRSVAGTVAAFYQTAGGDWYQDDTVTFNVALKGAEVGWQLLSTKTITVKAAAAPPPPGEWSLLSTATLNITAGPLPEKWELVEHYIDPWAYFWDGEVETATAQYTLPPEEFPWTGDIATKITESMKSDLLDQGSHLLEWEVYLDQAGPLWSRWLIKVTGTIPSGTSRQIGWVLPWPLIIKGAFIIAALVIIYLIVKQITSSIYQRKGLSEAVKKQWTKETLMGIILDLRPAEYTREDLEGKSDQELRDITNQIYKEEVPPGGLPWYVWLGITGIAIGGSLVAVKAIGAFAPSKKKVEPEKKKEE